MERDLGFFVNAMLHISKQRALASGASDAAVPASQGKGLSCSILQWGGLTLSIICTFGHHNIKKTLRY